MKRGWHGSYYTAVTARARFLSGPRLYGRHFDTREDPFERGIECGAFRHGDPEHAGQRGADLRNAAEDAFLREAARVVGGEQVVAKRMTAIAIGASGHQRRHEVRIWMVGNVPARDFVVHEQLFLKIEPVQRPPDPFDVCLLHEVLA